MYEFRIGFKHDSFSFGVQHQDKEGIIIIGRASRSFDGINIAHKKLAAMKYYSKNITALTLVLVVTSSLLQEMACASSQTEVEVRPTFQASGRGLAIYQEMPAVGALCGPLSHPFSVFSTAFTDSRNSMAFDVGTSSWKVAFSPRLILSSMTRRRKRSGSASSKVQTPSKLVCDLSPSKG
jgi:hypothetical protein